MTSVPLPPPRHQRSHHADAPRRPSARSCSCRHSRVALPALPTTSTRWKSSAPRSRRLGQWQSPLLGVRYTTLQPHPRRLPGECSRLISSVTRPTGAFADRSGSSACMTHLQPIGHRRRLDCKLVSFTPLHRHFHLAVVRLRQTPKWVRRSSLTTVRHSSSTLTLDAISLGTLLPFIGILLILLGSLALAIAVYVRAEHMYGKISVHNDAYLSRRYGSGDKSRSSRGHGRRGSGERSRKRRGDEVKLRADAESTDDLSARVKYGRPLLVKPKRNEAFRSPDATRSTRTRRKGMEDP